MIPEALDGWTLHVVRRLVEQGVFETDRFDFKEKLPHPNDESGTRRRRRDAAAFANSSVARDAERVSEAARSAIAGMGRGRL